MRSAQVKSQRIDFGDLAVTITALLQDLNAARLHPAEFAGLYVVLFIQKVFPPPKSWLGSVLKIPVVDSVHDYAPSHPLLDQNKQTNLLSTLMPFTDKERAKITKSFAAIQKEPTVINLYRYFSINSIPHYVNEFIVNWAAGHRPVELFFDMPTAQQILDQQTRGKRCVTIFVKKEELNNIIKDPYPPFEEKTVLKFMVHDIQHMEKFVEPRLYSEQVATFGLLKRVPDHPFFAHYDKQWQEDYDHAISDMNTCCTHTLMFFKAKWILAEVRHRRATRPIPSDLDLSQHKTADQSLQQVSEGMPKVKIVDEGNEEMNMESEESDLSKKKHSDPINYMSPSEEEEFNKMWIELMKYLDLPDDVIDATTRLCSGDETPFKDRQTIRFHLHDLGMKMLGLEFPL
eukprot:TRINITY_DN3539_c0_g1_i2.p1 TRINITY_DN3539_c0_g1~~TRINITY_DN3539_c0_g1_i2.p1  ORF type:complete len:401 (+),score=80.93 TRINITY_DN3539_c0_g1_i2:441-1643(+)